MSNNNTASFYIPEETMAWLASMPARPSPRRGPSRSSTYHEADSKYALRVHHNRRFSLASPPVLPPRVVPSEQAIKDKPDGDDSPKPEQKASLMDLPTEILDTIVGYAITPAGSDEPVIDIRRKETEEACTAADIDSGAVVSKWSVSNYPSNLFLVNHTISAIAFRRVWADSAVNICLTTTDAFCFLIHALSERQRAAMRRARFPKIMLSWTDPIGKDVWLREGSKGGRVAPGFFQEEEKRRLVQEKEQKKEKEEADAAAAASASASAAAAAGVAVRPSVSRMQSLVGLLQTRSSPALGLVVH